MEQHQYKYEFTPVAEQDIDDIFSYVSDELHSPQAADRLIDRIQEEVESVCDFPFSRSLLTDPLLRARGYRLIVVENFNLFYIVENDVIVIHRVLYRRRNYRELL